MTRRRCDRCGGGLDARAMRRDAMWLPTGWRCRSDAACDRRLLLSPFTPPFAVVDKLARAEALRAGSRRRGVAA